MIDPTIIRKVGLSENDFYLQKIRYIWETFTRLENSRINIDILTVANDMTQAGKLDEVGGNAYLTYLLSAVPTTLNAEHYAQVIIDHRRNRDRIKIASELVKKAYSGNSDISDIMASLANSAGVGQAARNLSDILGDVYDDIAARSANPSDVWGVPFGFGRLDKFTGGWQDGELTMLSGDSGLGKTYYATQIAMQAAANTPVAFFSMEMGEKSIARRMLKLAGVDGRKMQTGFMEPSDWMGLDAAMSDIARLPITIDSRKYGLMDFRARCSKLVSEFGVTRVIVDYLLLMDVQAKDEIEKTAKISGFIKSVCNDLKLGVLLIHSLNKGGMDNNDAEKSNMRGSGQVVYDADNVFILTRFTPDKSNSFEASIMPSDHDRIIRLTIKKGRELDWTGGSVLYMRKDATPKFTELDPEENKITSKGLR
jgi:replicative DNA helicase